MKKRKSKWNSDFWQIVLYAVSMIAASWMLYYLGRAFYYVYLECS